MNLKPWIALDKPGVNTLETMIRKDIDPLLEGLAILGTGGGGSPQWGKAILEHDLDQGRSVQIVDPQDVPDGACIASGGIMGSVKELDRIDPVELVRRWDDRFELAEAFNVMQETIGRKIDFVVAFEMGGLNTPVILSLGARIGLPVIDGDGLGRAAPETQMVSFIGHGISLTPMPLVDVLGNIVVVSHGVENTFADQLGRWVITRGGGMGANAHYPMSGTDLKRSVIPNTISKAMEIGNALIMARAQKTNPVDAVSKMINGVHIHTGEIEEIEENDWEGFYFTRVTLRGGAEIVIKNEAMALFLKGKAVTVFPDLICMLDPASGRGLMSADLKPGDNVALVVAPCHPRLRAARTSKEGRIAFSPERFGQPDLKYQEVENLITGW